MISFTVRRRRRRRRSCCIKRVASTLYFYLVRTSLGMQHTLVGPKIQLKLSVLQFNAVCFSLRAHLISLAVMGARPAASAEPMGTLATFCCCSYHRACRRRRHRRCCRCRLLRHSLTVINSGAEVEAEWKKQIALAASATTAASERIQRRVQLNFRSDQTAPPTDWLAGWLAVVNMITP